MSASEQVNSTKSRRGVSTGHRIGGAIVFLLVILVFGVLYANAVGWISLRFWFGICGFKQATGWPCPGCYGTTAAQAFVRGRIIESFCIHPAGAIFCCGLLAAGVFGFLIAVFGMDFGFLHSPTTGRFVKFVVIGAIIVLCLGWVVTLIRTARENGLM